MKVRRAPLVPPIPNIDYTAVKPNEVGRIPVLMYHAIGAPPYDGVRYDSAGLNIPPDTFRQQLEMMYAANWYPVNMRDALTARMQVPVGKTPVVITFDDSRGTQLRYLEDGSMDPDCAVAILEQFHATHPDWPLRATFYVLPESRWNPAPFYQRKSAARKLQYLVSQGYEIANHSTTHRLMTHLDAHTLAWEMAQCIRYVKKLAPAATMDTMALPGGARPSDGARLAVLLHGCDGGITYENRCILDAWGGPTPSPISKHFDRTAILRIGSQPGNIETWIERLSHSRHFRPYVSDGDPDVVSVPRSCAAEVNPKRLDGARLYIYDDGTGKKVVKKSRTKISHRRSKRRHSH